MLPDARLCRVCRSLPCTISDLESHPSREFYGESQERLLVTLPMHDSWESFCDSFQKKCPICRWIWQSARPSLVDGSLVEEPQFGSCKMIIQKPRRDFVSLRVCLAGLHRKEPDIWLSLKRRDHANEGYFQGRARDWTAPIPMNFDLPSSQFSQQSIDQVQSWLNSCNDHHQICHWRHPLQQEGWVPTRLVRLHADNTWSVVTSRDLKAENISPEYVALSHRWHARIPQLTIQNYLDLLLPQPDANVSKDYQDVLVLCRLLGFFYIWIDSLCIIQGLGGEDDWKAEAVTMTDVFMNATLTVSITRECEVGCMPERDVDLLRPVPFIFPDDKNIDSGELTGPPSTLYLINCTSWKRDVVQSPINARGWVFQERILSPRLLYVGNNELFWECDSMVASETFHDGVPYETPYLPTVYTPGRRNTRGASRAPVTGDARHLRQIWKLMVKKYSGTEFSFEKDRVVAFLGIKSTLTKQLSDTFLAGLWENWIIEDLLWYEIDSESNQAWTQRNISTWSWFSARGAVQYSETISLKVPHIFPFSPGSVARLRRFHPSESNHDLFDHLLNYGSLEVECFLLPGDISHSSCPTCQRGHGLVNFSVRLGTEISTQTIHYEMTEDSDHGLQLRFDNRYDQAQPIYLAPLLNWSRSCQPDEACLSLNGLLVQKKQPLAVESTIQSYERVGVFWDDLRRLYPCLARDNDSSYEHSSVSADEDENSGSYESQGADEQGLLTETVVASLLNSRSASEIDAQCGSSSNSDTKREGDNSFFANIRRKLAQYEGGKVSEHADSESEMSDTESLATIDSASESERSDTESPMTSGSEGENESIPSTIYVDGAWKIIRLV